MDNRRRYERKFVRTDEVRGTFNLSVAQTQYTFDRVEDVSISGLGVLLPVRLNVNDQVRLSYQDDGLRICVEGFVAWVEGEAAGEMALYRTGIRFSRDDISSNVMFFMALREYIDIFSEAS